jgi:uncharacterized protein YdbL (DUF1318 family)
MNRVSKIIAAAALAGTLVSAPAFAQRDPAYEAARAAGQVGEKMDGYLGIVGGANGALQAVVSDVNIKRRALYSQRAQAASPPVTLEEYALTAGCIAIARTAPGEKYQAPDGSWQTRTSAPPLRDSRCPALQQKNAQ